jgi:uncharacterized protein
MSSNLVQDTIDFINKNPFLELATVDSNGQPMVHPVAFAAKDGVAYFGTSKLTRKVKNCEANNKVGYSIYTTPENPSEMMGVQIEGIMEIVTDQKELQLAQELIAQKFPMLANRPPDSNSIIMKIIPKHGYLLDYSKGFGHRDEIHF